VPLEEAQAGGLLDERSRMSTNLAASGDALPTAEEFLRGVLRSGLLSREELQAALRGVPKDRRDDTRVLAGQLLRLGKLTRFQVSKLLRGVTQGMIIGPFRVLMPLGKGGMGTVFLVRDERSAHLVALKVLPPRVARAEQRLLARFRREMEMSQKVAHPHLAWTYEVGEIRGVHYIAMEYIPGRTLSRLVTEEGPLPWKRASRLMAEVAAGLEHAHNQGLIHRDLKPSNIQITPRDHAKVLDLGLALVHGEEVEDNMVVGGQGYIVGSMDYIAPEQTIDASGVDRRSDLYSLGCTLYFSLVGHPPFPGGTSKEKIFRHRGETPTPIAQLVPDLPPGFVALIERLMCKDAAGRPLSASAAEEELRAWAAGEVVLPLDALEELKFDESGILRQAPGSSEFSKVSLPQVEFEPIITPPERPRWSPLPLLMLALSTAILLMGAMVLLLAWLAARR
jgi:serine/threonine protein kinase